MQVLCPFPRESRKRREDQQFDINTIALGYAISISNNADVFSVEDFIVIFHSMCLSCMKQNGSILCNNKPGYCAQQGDCFENGDRLQCYTCTEALTWHDSK
ncbi:hypothetical protein DPMN_135652 [Dreissena polymorpha]|uniref:Uncharacterized protein n=1 Tax=Dreissena polymorpha TaxID=45954 RepID=A0A9D4G4C3_DREPO|nr:hypothetical protein DPMN_135652 [Dreissena polymorpha]